jgi:hypothetical protein
LQALADLPNDRKLRDSAGQPSLERFGLRQIGDEDEGALDPEAAISQLRSLNGVIQDSAELKNIFNVQTEDVAGYPLPTRAVYLTLTVSAGESNPRSSQ